MPALGFNAFVTGVYGDIPNKTSGTLAALRKITIRQLRELSGWRTLFMEATAEFTLPLTAPWGGEYADRNAPGFPPDVLGIDLVYYLVGTQKIEIPRANSMTDLRLASGVPSRIVAVSGGRPEQCFWFDNKLWFEPRVDANATLYMDFFRDATLDLGGNLITEDSVNETNPWFDRGELALRYAVLSEYYMMPTWRDEAQAQACIQLRNRYLQTLKDEHHSLKGSSQVAPMVMGGSV